MTTNDDLTRIEVDQYFPHPAAKLWRALTTPELMAQWLMPNDFEPVVGHRFTFRGSPVAQTEFSGQIACQVLDLVPQKRLQISWGDTADINRDSIWKRAEEFGWTLNGNISLSDTWSSVRIKSVG